MGCWGMGITQSDDYMDVYERFMEEYEIGKPIIDITNDILEEWLNEFDANDGVLHDVYFALGKAQWMCGGITNEILIKIEDIIVSEGNIKFLRELNVNENDLKIRKKNLVNFLSALKEPRGKCKKRKISEEKYIASGKPKTRLPQVHEGDLLCYSYNNHYHPFAVVKEGWFYDKYSVYILMWKKWFDHIPTFDELKEEEIIPAGYFFANTFPDKIKVIRIGNYLQITKLEVWQIPRIYDKWISKIEDFPTEDIFFQEEDSSMYITFNKAYNIARKL